jgi:hypothetical protein
MRNYAIYWMKSLLPRLLMPQTRHLVAHLRVRKSRQRLMKKPFMEKRYIVKLTAQEREDLHTVLRRGKQNATVIRRANVLLACDESE